MRNRPKATAALENTGVAFDIAYAAILEISPFAWRDFSAEMLLVLAARIALRPRLKLAA